MENSLTVTETLKADEEKLNNVRNLTLTCKLQLFGIRERGPFVGPFFLYPAMASSFLRLSPKIGSTMHAWYIQNSNSFQRDVY